MEALGMVETKGLVGAIDSQEQVETIVEAMAAAARAESWALAKLAVEETGYGNVTSKHAKNMLAARSEDRAAKERRSKRLRKHLHSLARERTMRVALCLTSMPASVTNEAKSDSHALVKWR